jgi:hypothetical protein
MAKQSSRTQRKGVGLCKPYKHRANGQAVRKPVPELRRLGRSRRVSRHEPATERHHPGVRAMWLASVGMTRPNEGLPKGIGAPATRALAAAGYTDLQQLAGVPKSELRRLHGVGPKALTVLEEELSKRGLSLA